MLPISRKESNDTFVFITTATTVVGIDDPGDHRRSRVNMLLATSNGDGTQTAPPPPWSMESQPLPALPQPPTTMASHQGTPFIRVYPHKVISFVRHGVAVHNEPSAREMAPEALFDAVLTERGSREVLAIAPVVRSLSPELVVVSPLTRTLQTAILIFPPPHSQAEGVEKARPPIVALDLCREAYGAHLCDKRRHKSELQEAFGGLVDLSLIEEADALWTPTRETVASVRTRATTMLNELMKRPETHILVVSHGVFIQHCLEVLFLLSHANGSQVEHNPDYAPGHQVLNCELNCVVLMEMHPTDVGGPPEIGRMRVVLVKRSTYDLLVQSGLGMEQSSRQMDDCVWMTQLFLKYSHGEYLLQKQHFCDLLSQCGVHEPFVRERYFRALDLRGRGALTFEEFVVGMAALDPDTASKGQWRHLRARFVFRAYDLDDDERLSFEEFKRMVEDIMSKKLAPGEQFDHAKAESEARRIHKGGLVTEEEFVSAVDQLRFTGTSVLFRAALSPVKCDTVVRQAMLDRSPPPRRLSQPRASPGHLPHVMVTPPSVVKVGSKVIHCHDVTKQRYSASPHDKEAHRRMAAAENGDCRDTTPPSAALAVANNIIRFFVDWDPGAPMNGPGVFSACSVVSLEPMFETLTEILAKEPSLLEVRAPARVFGDIHGHLVDLLRLFRAYGFPDPSGDINVVEYIFNGDWVDRGTNSCDVVLLLFSLKVCYPRRIFLIRGNHECRPVNAQLGFLEECIRRLGQPHGPLLWELCNTAFDLLPLAARIERKILVLHGGIGATLRSVDQIAALRRPIKDGESEHQATAQLLRDILWSDPTPSDDVVGVHPNPRGHNIFQFGPDVVKEFCSKNDIDCIIRSHEVVNAGYEFFSGEQLLTVFSATGYCKKNTNNGAILEISRDLEIHPKVVQYQAAQWSLVRDSSPPRGSR